MKEEHKKYIREHYQSENVRQMADHLGISKNKVASEVSKLLLNRQGSPYIKLLLSVIIPVIFLVLLEFTLRLAGLHDNTALLLTTEKDSTEYYELNKNVAKRWFISGNTSIPELNNTLLYTVDKPDTVKRILCLGGSTTAGFPYDNLPPFPTLVRLKLQRLFPRYTIETVNLGISAINSYSVADIAKETLALKPDLVLIYMGQNEFYGAFGAASSQSFGTRGLIKTLLWLDRFAIVQNLRKLITPSLDKNEISRRNKTLMAQMIKDKFIGLNSEKFVKTSENFNKNYSEIINTYQNKHVPVIISTLVSNLKDQRPFESKWSPDNLKIKQKEWLQAESHLKMGDFQKAKTGMESLFEQDTTYAELDYFLGKFALADRDSMKAKKLFTMARNYDGMRFRAPSEWNRIILQLGDQKNVPVVKMDSIFSAFSRDGIIGHELLLEHLHPNWHGYNLMADAFVRQILSSHLIDDKTHPFTWTKLENYLWYNITDVEIGNLVHSILTKGWPFNNEEFEYDKYKPLAPKVIAENVKNYVSSRGYWNKLHYQSAEYFINNKDYMNAIREYAAVAAYLPDARFPREKIGFLYLVQQNFKQAYVIYRQLLNRYPDDAEYKCLLGQSLAMGFEFQKAIHFLEEGIVEDVRAGRKLKDKEFYNFKFWLGFCYANTGQLLFAKRQLEQVIQNFPEHQEARKLLNQVIQYHRAHSQKKK